MIVEEYTQLYTARISDFTTILYDRDREEKKKQKHIKRRILVL